MKTTSNFIQELRRVYPSSRISYSYPMMLLDVIDRKFSDDFDSNISIVSADLGMPPKDVVNQINRPLLSVSFFNNADLATVRPVISADFWLAAYDGYSLNAGLDPKTSCPRSVHFYGYKGGQGRSTTLSLLARDLAAKGLRVLVIDADIEASSLDVFFDCTISTLSASLMGACDASINIEPVTVYAQRNGGQIGLIGCRPTSAEFDFDFAAFSLNASLDPSVIKAGIERLRTYATKSDWDIALFDHRTGLASSVLPAVSSWPGSVVMSLRPDKLSLPALKIAKTLFSSYSDYPGAFVCFSMDPERSKSNPSTTELLVREKFLSVLAASIEAGAEESGLSIDPQDLDSYFVTWYHDSALLSNLLPDPEQISHLNRNSLSDLKEVLGISTLMPKEQELPTPVTERSPSGSLDNNWFIETENISKLMQASSSITYVFGRKGTGKTRIYREMAARKIAKPLLASADYIGGGFRAQSVTTSSLLDLCQNDFELFWWRALFISIENNNSSESLEDIADKRLRSGALQQVSVIDVADKVRSLGERSLFLVDGVETSVGPTRTKLFVESLFRFVGTIQNDSSLNAKVSFRIFLRPDLSVGIQNIEQQVFGRKVELRWDEDSIFNYMLAEIHRKEWFQGSFKEACLAIGRNMSAIKEGRLKRDEYDEIILQIFPQKFRRNNLLTLTFLRTYFSDSVSDSDKRSSFYPRVIGSFLDHIAELCKKEPNTSLGSDGRISSAVIQHAFDSATGAFIDEIKQELYFALNLAEEMGTNRSLVDDLIVALAGLQTPFVLEECIEKLVARLTVANASEHKLRDALRQMKEMGIFETHPSDPGKWRAGRLFKEALRMKYVR